MPHVSDKEARDRFRKLVLETSDTKRAQVNDAMHSFYQAYINPNK